MRFTFLLITAVVAIVAGVAALQISKKDAPPIQPTTVQVPSSGVETRTANVLVAKADIPVGTTIDATMVDVQPWPEHLVLEGFLLGDQGSNEVVGQVARAPIQAREPFLKGKLANPNDPGFLSAGLPSGMRAITIATDAVSGIAGFIFPGDRVDVVFVHSAVGDDAQASSGKPAIAEVLVPNVRVLAVNLREAAPNSGPPVTSPSSVTVEISDQAAQQVRLAEKSGTISLALRSIKDDNATVPDPTRLNDLSHDKGPVSGDDVVIVRGPGSAGGQITSNKMMLGGVPAEGGSGIGSPVSMPGGR